MVFHNDPDKYIGIQPLDEHVVASTYLRDQAPPTLRDGLYYRQDITIDAPAIEAKILARDESTTVQEYQYWAETAWKAEHGTYPAIERFGDKLFEEVDELARAFNNLRHGEKPDDQLKADIVAEAGDVLWCATALACCLTAGIDPAMKNRLFKYVSGVRFLDNNQEVEPRWRPKAAELATKYGHLSLGDIGDLINGGFEPLPSPVMTISDYDGRDDSEPLGHLLVALGLSHALVNTARNQFGRPENEPENYQTESGFTENARAAGEIAAAIYLEVAFITQRTTGASLDLIIAANVAKLSERVRANTVDKRDGDRSAERH